MRKLPSGGGGDDRKGGRTISRRDLLAAGAFLGAASAVTTGSSPSGAVDALRNATSGRSLSDIEHVVILMQENRSFDHYFGTLSGVRGFSDPLAMNRPDGLSVFSQPDIDLLQ